LTFDLKNVTDTYWQKLIVILLHKKLLKIYIKYPIIKGRCELYYARAISQTDGKLLIGNLVVKSANTEEITFQ